VYGVVGIGIGMGRMVGREVGRMVGTWVGLDVGGGHGAYPVAKGTLPDAVEEKVAVEVDV
jgi:hypothetical protein